MSFTIGNRLLDQLHLLPDELSPQVNEPGIATEWTLNQAKAEMEFCEFPNYTFVGPSTVYKVPVNISAPHVTQASFLRKQEGIPVPPSHFLPY